MSDEAARHYSQEEVHRYMLRLASAAEAEALERHLAECDPCTALARRAYAESGLSGRWSPEAHAAAAARESLLSAVCRALRALPQGMDSRISTWLESPAEVYRSAVRIVRGSEGVFEVLAPGGGAFAQAGGYLGSEPGTLAVFGDEERQAEIFRGAGGQIGVRVAALEPDSPPPAILVAPAGSPEASRLLEFAFHSRSMSWVAQPGELPEDSVIAILPDPEP